jgi:hypothetical protein
LNLDIGSGERKLRDRIQLDWWKFMSYCDEYVHCEGIRSQDYFNSKLDLDLGGIYVAFVVDVEQIRSLSRLMGVVSPEESIPAILFILCVYVVLVLEDPLL